ncbi:peroxidase-like protein [Ostrea edulis]|uniref:peroxidase-like protein n=1 Tax=Ostrea edulis TaxID=37623 RepID=UPI00209426A6|nr:peroxidase-like protein [Ostrea edulis]
MQLKFVLILLAFSRFAGTWDWKLGAIVSDLVNRMMSSRNISGYIPVEFPSLTEHNNARGNSRGSYHSAVQHHYRYLRINDFAMTKTADDRARIAAFVARTVAVMSGKRTADEVRPLLQDPFMLKIFHKAFEPYCYEEPRCRADFPYRHTCGACNNLKYPLLGKAFTVYRRIVPSSYEDGIEMPRTKSKDGHLLPSSRRVSNVVHNNNNQVEVSARFTPYLTHFGQFLDHDISSTPVMTDSENNIIEDCCINPNRIECFNIPIANDDPYFTDPTQKCMHFVRSDIGPVPACDTGIRQQLNQRSSFIDGSAIYGFNTAKENSLREKQGGLLRVSRLHSYRPGILPEGEETQCENEHNGLFSRSPINHCFDAGDHRHTESPLLAVIHIMFLRRHNLIAEALQQATGITDDEVLFQETKRIIVAELNHVVYNEYLPDILAPEFINYFGLKSTRMGHHTVYDPNVDPRAINSFAAAAYRFGHSFVQSVVGQDNGRSIREDPLRKNFDNPTFINFPQNGGCEFVASWMANTGKADMDRFVTTDLRNHLFDAAPTGTPTTSPGATLSLDLVALNIQRGRDHGLPGYNVFRQWCGRPRAEHFGTWSLGLIDHDEQSAAILQSIYRHPDDVDLFAGALSEKNLGSSLMGPTFSCIVGFQFNRLKLGDRFWYENKFPLTGFTEEQLVEMKKVTMSKIMCSTLVHGSSPVIQPLLFRRQTVRRNQPISCNRILGQSTPLGFDIEPFVRELRNLGGRRQPLQPGVNLNIPPFLVPQQRRQSGAQVY